MRTALIAILAQVVACGAVLADDTPADLARKSQEIFVKHCTKCHGKVNPQSGLSVLDLKTLAEKGYVTAGKLNDSQLWERVSSNDESIRMPPPPTGALPAPDQAVIQKWIEAGAPAFPVSAAGPRPFMTMKAVFLAMDKDLRNYPPEDQGNLRYFSLTHLHNNPAVSDKDLRMYRAALAKLCNSLSWEPNLVLPEPIDEYRTVYRVTVVKLGWDRDRLWNRMLTQYPYGLSYDSHSDNAFRTSADYVYNATGTRLPVIRADWFVANAAQPPLYEAMLRLPTGVNADKIIEKQLNVDTTHDFLTDREQRAGFNKSNVSEHNRMVARHPASTGAYWVRPSTRTPTPGPRSSTTAAS
jgi:hypothetical protein